MKNQNEFYEAVMTLENKPGKALVRELNKIKVGDASEAISMRIVTGDEGVYFLYGVEQAFFALTVMPDQTMLIQSRNGVPRSP